MNSYRTTLTVAVFLAAALFAGVTAAQDPLPDAPGRQIVVDVCTQCHAADVIASPKRSRQDWSQILDRMEGMGAAFSEVQHAAMLEYLSTHVGVAAPAAPGPAPAAPAAPAPTAPVSK